MKKLLVIGVAACLGIIIAPIVWVWIDTPVTHPDHDSMLPWQIELLPNGASRVFGLTLGNDLLDDARARFGPTADIAIVAPRDRPPLLEAHYESVNAGFITGRLILTAELDDHSLRAMRERALREDYMESVTRRITLHPEDLARARSAPIRVLTFIPSARLDEATIHQRFGLPEARVVRDGGVIHLQYPALGLDVALGGRGQAVLQYVAPGHFDRLLGDNAQGLPAQD